MARHRRTRERKTLDAAEASPAVAPPPEQPDPWTRALKAVSAIGPPVTLGAALLLYFGWARSDAQARAIGLDVSLFGYSPQDYMLRSISSLFTPLIVICVAMLVWWAVDQRLRRLMDEGRHIRAIRVSALVIGIGSVAGGLALAGATVASPRQPIPFRAYLMAIAVLLAAWSVRLYRRSEQDGRPSPERHLVEGVIVAALVTLLLFWGTADYAQAVGNRLAADFETSVDDMPRGTIYSPSALSITAPGVVESTVGTEAEPLYRYTGLRLLVVSGGRVFFLNDGWTRVDGTVIVMPDDESIRYEFQN